MDEVGIITDYVTQSLSKDALVIWGTGIDPNLGDMVNVTIIATGFKANNIPELHVVKTRNTQPERIPLYDNHNPDELNFQVKEKTNGEGLTQRTIEFDMIEKKTQTINLASEEMTEYEVKVNPQKTSEKTTETKKGHSKLKETTGYTSIDEKSNIEELENTPAYVRKNVKIDQNPKTDTTISKYSLTTDEDNNIRLRQNNSYLYDNVD
jgi:cell division protein FtsZ